MIFQRGRYWALPNDTRKFSSREEAQAAYDKIVAKQELIRKHEEETIKRLLDALDEDSTPFEIMIQKNICKLCNLEPCECFTSIKKTEPGP